MNYEELEKENERLSLELAEALAARHSVAEAYITMNNQLKSMKEQRDFMMNEQCEIRRGEK